MDTESTSQRRHALLNLEEQVRLHEATLQAQRARRDQLLKEQEQARQRKQRFLEQREALYDRYQSLVQTKDKNTSLQQNLRDSLLKSRERLQRLTTLEAMMYDMETEQDENIMMTEIDQTPTNNESQGSETREAIIREGGVVSDFHHHTNVINDHDKLDVEPMDDHDANAQEETTEQTNSENGSNLSNSYKLVNVYSYEWLQKYHSNFEDRLSMATHNGIFMPFLPCLDASQVHQYMLLSMREANALDLDNTNFGTSLRRNLVGHTSLDIRMLASLPESTISMAKMKNEDAAPDSLRLKGAQIMTTTSLVDPNLSLCPYELAGTCADNLCPYQHIEKEPKIVARERLPLPNLDALLEDRYGVENTSKEPTNDEISEDKSQTSVEDMHIDVTGKGYSWRASNQIEEQNFISLPNDGVESGLPGTIVDDAASQSEDEKEDFSLSNDGRFWWGGQLPPIASSGSPSVIDVFHHTFMLTIIPGATEFDDGYLTIVNSLADPKDAPGVEGLAQKCRHLGSMVDAIQLALHAGRYDVAFTLCKALESKSLAESSHMQHDGEMLQATLHDEVINRIKALVEKAFMRNRESSLSIFENTFAIHANISLLSLVIRGVADFLDGPPMPIMNSSLVMSLAGLIQNNVMFGSKTEMHSENPSKTFDTSVLEKFLGTKVREGPDSIHVFVDRMKLDISQLQELCLWTKRVFGRTNGVTTPRETNWEGCLQECWSVVARDLRKQGQTEAGKGETTLLQGTKSMIAIGQVIQSCLCSFANETLLHDNMQRETFTSLDRMVHQILKEVGKLTNTIPMSSILLAPLCASSIVTASLLRNYATAQQRLENFLDKKVPTKEADSPSYDSLTLLPYSEVLWSQLVQLRMSFPNEALVSEERDARDAAAAKTSVPIVKTIDEQPLWEPSNAVKQVVKQVADKLEMSDIRLHHLGLWGDEILSQIVVQGSAAAATVSSTLLYFASTDNRSPKASSNFPQSLEWSVVLRHPNSDDDSSRRHVFLNLTPFPLPLHILHTGHHLLSLNLSHSFLSCLPRSFAWYFPNMETLDLSYNELAELPLSFQNLAKRMAKLRTFLLQNNCLKLLPDDIFRVGGAGTRSVRSCLEILNISNNQLAKFPFINAQVFSCLEELHLDHNNLVDISLAELSRLVLKIPSLRHLSLSCQGQANTTGQDEMSMQA
ncbi:zinc-finger domain containing protein [Nitzschia inconspicua]|uniref:Zinc-finger domain containing protein n=1 Tax=Nitzschia inconspicua TaxID=303405 RepID=A0A9K3LU56_9STRA|nr:zinc-finger domain containing protein [Nitzschia inconspicua]